MKATTTTRSGSTVNYKKFLTKIISTILPKELQTPTTQPKTKPTNTTSKKTCEYIVKSGDTLWSISDIKLGNGANYKSIVQENNLPSVNINPGQKLKVGCCS